MLNKTLIVLKILNIVEWFQRLLDKYDWFKEWKQDHDEQVKKIREERKEHITDIQSNPPSDSVFNDPNNRSNKPSKTSVDDS